MKCPKCENTLEDITVDNVEFDFCCKEGGCQGIWCDNAELSFYVSSTSDFPFIDQLNTQGQETSHNCPRCHDKKLVELPYDKDVQLLVDFCKSCHGIWLDPSELGKIKKLNSRVPLKERLKAASERMKSKGFKIL